MLCFGLCDKLENAESSGGDYGGVSGYQNLIEALSDRRHPEHRELRMWAGKHYDPELFSVQAVNSALASLVALSVTR